MRTCVCVCYSCSKRLKRNEKKENTLANCSRASGDCTHRERTASFKRLVSSIYLLILLCYNNY